MTRNKRAWVYGNKGFDAAVLPEAKSYITEVIEDAAEGRSHYAYKIVDEVAQAFEVSVEVRLTRVPKEDLPASTFTCEHEWVEMPDVEPPYDICFQCGARKD